MAEETAPKPKRRLRAAPETFRERAEKAQTASDKPRRLKLPTGTVGKVTRPFGAVAKPFRSRAFGPVRWVLRLFAKLLLLYYVRDSWRELRLVTWPNRRESRRLTTAVLLFAIVFGLVIAAVDYGLDKLFKKVLLS